jgi:hypothetical protein
VALVNGAGPAGGGPFGGGGGPAGSPFGGFRVFTVGRDAARNFRFRPAIRVREGAGAFERALVGALAFLLAIPIAVVLLALGAVALVAFLGCAAVFVALAIAGRLVRMLVGGGRAVRGDPDDDGRENVRVIRRQDPFG